MTGQRERPRLHADVILRNQVLAEEHGQRKPQVRTRSQPPMEGEQLKHRPAHLPKGTRLGRASNDAAGIVGLWAFSAIEFNTQHFLFLPSGKVLMIDPLGDTQAGACMTARMGPAGGEYASYTFDKVTGVLTVSGKLYDTNGCAGMFDIGTGANTSFTATVQLSSDGKTATVDAGDGAFTLYRVATQ